MASVCCCLGPPEPIYNHARGSGCSWQIGGGGMREACYGHDSGSPGARYGPFRAPSADGIMREADFDYGTELAALVATQPLPMGAVPPGLEARVDLDVDVAGRVADKERIMRQKETWKAYLLTCAFCPCCKDGAYAWTEEKAAAERGAANAHSVALVGDVLTFQRAPHRAAVPKNFTTTDKHLSGVF